MIHIHPRAEPFYIAGQAGKAVLFIHGFTASPSEVYPVARLINENLNCTVSGILLPGHGSHPRLLNRTTWQNWYQAVEDELQHLLKTHEEVYAVGLSMGGLLAIYAGLHIPELTGIVSINAPIFNRTPWKIALASALQWVCPYVRKPNRNRTAELRSLGRYAYEVYPIKAMRSLLNLRKLVMQEIPDLKTPLLLIQSRNDESVDPRSVNWIGKHIKQAIVETIFLEHSGHVATMGTEKDIIADNLINFINRRGESGVRPKPQPQGGNLHES